MASARGSQPLPSRWALPQWGSPVAPCVPQSIHRETQTLVSLRGNVSPLWCGQGGEAGYAIPVCSAAGGRRQQSSTVTEQRAVRSRDRFMLEKGWALPGRVGWSASRSTSDLWLLLASVTPPTAIPGEQTCPTLLPKSSWQQAGDGDRLHAVLGASACSDHIRGMEK